MTTLGHTWPRTLRRAALLFLLTAFAGAGCVNRFGEAESPTHDDEI